MKPVALALSLSALLSWAPIAFTQTSRTSQAPAGLDTAAIARAIGRAGQMIGTVYKISLPRTDLQVSVNGMKIRPGLALGSWMAFEPVGGQAAADGDLVLTENEVNGVISRLEQAGLEVTAVHNHLLNETPRVMYVHFFGRGDAAQIARGLKAALSATQTPLTETGAGGEAGLSEADRIQQILGLKGTVKGGLLSLSSPRSERITMMGVELPPSMGMATSMNFQEAGGGRVAATGDFVLAGDEVNPVIRALREHRIEVTALHNHMIHGSPELYFMHFWANDSAETVATGLKAALDAMKR